MEITLWLTYMCNLNCTYCYEGSEKKNLHMNMETAKKAIEYVSNRISEVEQGENVNINLHGGEPLLNFEVLAYIMRKLKKIKDQYQDKINISISLTTNAVLLNEEILKILIENIDYLAISIDGDIESHDCNRVFHNGEGSFHIVEKNAKMALQFEPEITARITITPQTVANLFENTKFLHELGFIHIASVINQYDPTWKKKHMNILNEQIEKMSNYQVEQEQAGKRVHLSMVREMEFRRKSFCLGGEKTIHISPDGCIYPCSHVVGDEKFNLGDVKNGIIEERLDFIREINSQKVERCDACKWSEICYGVRCKLINYAMTGDFLTPSPVTCMNEHCLMQGYEYYCNLKDKLCET